MIDYNIGGLRSQTEILKAVMQFSVAESTILRFSFAQYTTETSFFNGLTSTHHVRRVMRVRVAPDILTQMYYLHTTSSRLTR